MAPFLLQMTRASYLTDRVSLLRAGPLSVRLRVCAHARVSARPSSSFSFILSASEKLELAHVPWEQDGYRGKR